ncbi:hypothetical protein D3C86_2196930 [compost metagenome]
MLCDSHDAFTGDTVKRGFGNVRGQQFAVQHEHDVHCARFFDILVIAGVGPDQLIVTFLLGEFRRV